MKALIKFNSDYVQFYDYDEFKEPNYSRTNILDYSELVLSYDFIMENYNFIYNFIKTKIIKNHITKVYIDKTTISNIVYKLIVNLPNINYIYINDKKKIDIELFEYLLNNKNIKTINCYDMSYNTLDRLNLSRKINIITRKKHCSSNHIYKENELLSLSDVYYKKDITINKKLENDDFNTLEVFFRINKYIKEIYIKYYDKNMIINIINIIKKYKIHNINIIIIGNNNNAKDILKSIDKIRNDKYLKKHKIKIKVKYEKEYIKKNIFKQLNINIIKTVLLIIIIVTSIIFIVLYFINKTKEYESKETIRKVQAIIEEPGPTNNEEVKDIKTEKPKKKSAYFKNYSQKLSELKKINKDTIGWLKINNSSINYPIVQTTNNEYYLDHSFDHKINLNGWLFLDYRSDPNNLSRNNVIYGHSGNYYVMFGSLYQTMKDYWLKNPNNHKITFNTSSNHTWQIFSIYVINSTNDYIQHSFKTDEEYLNFLNKMKSRSIYDFGQTLSVNDKILTLSTCYKDSGRRLVVQAKLIQ